MSNIIHVAVCPICGLVTSACGCEDKGLEEWKEENRCMVLQQKIKNDELIWCSCTPETIAASIKKLSEERDRAIMRFEERDKDAATEAFDKIAEICGCPQWDYPGQLVRDVQELKDSKNRAVQLQTEEESIRYRLEARVSALELENKDIWSAVEMGRGLLSLMTLERDKAWTFIRALVAGPDAEIDLLEGLEHPEYWAAEYRHALTKLSEVQKLEERALKAERERDKLRAELAQFESAMDESAENMQ